MFFRFNPKKPDQGDDIALIRLPSLAKTVIEDPDELVLPVCMPWNDTIEIKENELFVMGWGRTNNDDTDYGSQVYIDEKAKESTRKMSISLSEKDWSIHQYPSTASSPLSFK